MAIVNILEMAEMHLLVAGVHHCKVVMLSEEANLKKLFKRLYIGGSKKRLTFGRWYGPVGGGGRRSGGRKV